MDPQRRRATCLLVVDLQRGFYRDFMGDLPQRIEAAQKQYDHVAVTRFINPPGSFYRTLIGWEQMGAGDPAASFAFTPRADAYVIEKASYNCVTQDFLDWLAAHNIDQVHLCGIRTDICVTQCAVGLFEQGIVPIVLADLCASTAGAEAHEKALYLLEKLVGAGQIQKKPTTY